MNRIKKAANSAKEFVVDHKVAFAVAATIVVMGKLNRIATSDQTNFIKEHGLWDEYCTPQD